MGVADDSAAFFEVCIYKYVCMDGWMDGFMLTYGSIDLWGDGNGCC